MKKLTGRWFRRCWAGCSSLKEYFECIIIIPYSKCKKQCCSEEVRLRTVNRLKVPEPSANTASNYKTKSQNYVVYSPRKTKWLMICWVDLMMQSWPRFKKNWSGLVKNITLSSEGSNRLRKITRSWSWKMASSRSKYQLTAVIGTRAIRQNSARLAHLPLAGHSRRHISQAVNKKAERKCKWSYL